MSQTKQKTGESDDLGPCVTTCDVVTRQQMRFEAAGKSGVAAMLGLSGFKNEQAVGRWGRKLGYRGGESPKWSWLLEQIEGWPTEMQDDVMRSLSFAMKRSVVVGPAGSGAGVTSTDAMPEALQGMHQAAKLVQMTHQFQADGEWTADEASEYQSAWDKFVEYGRSAMAKVMHAVPGRKEASRSTV